METSRKTFLYAALLLAGLTVGCRSIREQVEEQVKYIGSTESELEHYKDFATQIDYPDVENEFEDEVLFTNAPRKIRDFSRDEIWDMPLAEALSIALANNEIIRDNGQFLSPVNRLLASPQTVPSIYDPAIQETGVLFGQRGVEAALSDFDTQFTTSILLGHDEQISNNPVIFGGLPPGSSRISDSGTFRSRLEKQFAHGGTLSLNHNWDYASSNVPGQLFPSNYTGVTSVEYRHPLWAASGTEYTRIAGPVGRNLSGVTGVNQGVIISRINSDIRLADFEISVRNLLRDVEGLYWDLSLGYRVYHSEVVSRNSALRSWREVKARANVGAEGGGAADEAQARDNYYDSAARVKDTLAELYSVEGRFRRLLGLSVNDGRFIRPSDEPVVAEFVPHWRMSLAEALTRRVELRRQKWDIKSLQLQWKAAKSLTKPRLDFVSSYRVNGFGDQLKSSSDDDGVTTRGLRSGFGSLTQGDETGWNLGFEFSVPIGFRLAHAQVQNLELRLAKAHKTLSAQEHEISHELAQAFLDIDRWYSEAIDFLNRRRAAETRVRAFEAEYQAGRTTLDLLLRAQLSRAQAEIAYYRSLIAYNKSIADLHFRKGTLLEHDNVYLAENSWKSDAYKDALQRAWARTFAIKSDKFLHTEPEEFVVEQTEIIEETGVENSMPLDLPPEPQIPYEEDVPALTPPPTGVDGGAAIHHAQPYSVWTSTIRSPTENRQTLDKSSQGK